MEITYNTDSSEEDKKETASFNLYPIVRLDDVILSQIPDNRKPTKFSFNDFPHNEDENDTESAAWLNYWRNDGALSTAKKKPVETLNDNIIKELRSLMRDYEERKEDFNNLVQLLIEETNDPKNKYIQYAVKTGFNPNTYSDYFYQDGANEIYQIKVDKENSTQYAALYVLYTSLITKVRAITVTNPSYKV